MKYIYLIRIKYICFYNCYLKRFELNLVIVGLRSIRPYLKVFLPWRNLYIFIVYIAYIRFPATGISHLSFVYLDVLNFHIFQ